MNEIFTGIFALVISYYGNLIHRASWLGGLVIYQAVASVVLLIPEIYKPITQLTETNITGS